MRLSFHGGMCCGIKHIFEMGHHPNIVCEELWPIKGPEGLPVQQRQDVHYDRTDQYDRVFHLAAPEETKLQRLDRYLDFLDEYRPSGIVEISLVTPEFGYSQAAWVPVLKERGFVEVTPEGGVYNSNSGNRVRVFHLYMGQDDHG